MQTELKQTGRLLNEDGTLNQVGWSRQPLLECNLEDSHFYTLRPLQRFRLKRWDYYAVFTPQRFFSATIADLGYAGNIFVYTLDFKTGELYEEGLVVPFSRGIVLPRSSDEGETHFANYKARLDFCLTLQGRRIEVVWPTFHKGRGIQAEFTLTTPPNHESMNIVIPIGQKRFYLNRKINCLPAQGYIQYGEQREDLQPSTCLGSLDWGRGVWDYRSYWNWASASGYLPDGRSLGLNLGSGFGDLSAATENCLVLNGRIHKLGDVQFKYSVRDYMQPWSFKDGQGRLNLTFNPIKDRTATTNLGVIYSQVHQMFGYYSGLVQADSRETIRIDKLAGFAEEHKARW